MIDRQISDIACASSRTVQLHPQYPVLLRYGLFDWAVDGLLCKRLPHLLPDRRLCPFTGLGAFTVANKFPSLAGALEGGTCV